jgi:DNA-binding NtrC family response regulator
VRELRNTIERAVLLSSGGAIRPTHLVLTPPRDQTRTRESQPTMPITRVSDIDITVDAPSRPSASLASEVAELERKRIVEALEQYGGNQTQVARVLGVSRGTLIARMELYGLRRPRKRDD